MMSPAGHGLSQNAIDSPNHSMVVTWVVAVGLIVCAQIATRTMEDVPEGSP